MRLTSVQTALLAFALVCGARTADAARAADPDRDAAQSASSEAFLLAPPIGAGPVVVRAHFELQDLDEVDEPATTFGFTGTLTLRWKDPRRAFDPAATGVGEQVFHGEHQVHRLSPAWYPQVVLVNSAGTYLERAVSLRVQPDGSSTLIQVVDACARSDFDMRRFPFDAHRLQAVFAVLGAEQDQVVVELEPDAPPISPDRFRVPQWTVTGVELSVGHGSIPGVGAFAPSSAFSVYVDVRRQPFFMLRLVVIPLFVIVLLSFTVFWMDRSSLGERMSVSFIGILTGVAYQNLVSEDLPQISYLTLMHGFLSISFFTISATVVLNLAVGVLERQGSHDLGIRIDHRCRWAFPSIYLGLNALALAATFLLS